MIIFLIIALITYCNLPEKYKMELKHILATSVDWKLVKVVVFILVSIMKQISTFTFKFSLNFLEAIYSKLKGVMK